MKKLLGILVLGLLWCNVSFSEILEFKKCYFEKKSIWFPMKGTDTLRTKYKSWDDFEQRTYLQDVIFTINFSAGTITRTVMKYGEVTSQQVYVVTTFTSDLITAKLLEDEAAGTFTKSTLYFDIKTLSAAFESITYLRETGQKGIVLNADIKCEETSDAIGDGDKAGSSGTAFFINNRGNLLTNNHVVEGCKSQKINYYNKEYEVKIIATDKTLDLALLKANVKPKSYISFSKKEPKKRQTITAAGYPLGEFLSDDLKINDGRISALKGFENNSNEIQHDIPINPGNSGGPIVNEKGQLVAIAVSGMAKDVTEGLNFGIKASAAANFLKSNKISPSTGYMSFSTSGDKLVKLLEESTVYTFCE